MRQGNDVGTQYRSGIYTADDAQRDSRRPHPRCVSAGAERGGSRRDHDRDRARPSEFFYAEDYHQQYLAKNPGGYCGLGGTGVRLQAG